jgi:hypothetical protein
MEEERAHGMGLVAVGEALAWTQRRSGTWSAWHRSGHVAWIRQRSREVVGEAPMVDLISVGEAPAV